MRRLGLRDVNREVFFDLPPPGKGAASSHVDSRFAERVRSHRARDSHTRSWLLVMRDADADPVQAVLERLESGLPKRRGKAERIALFIPKWRIETWIEYLRTGQEVDEVRSDYPKLDHESDCHPGVDRFLEMAQDGGRPDNCPPSLRRVIEEEYPRLADLNS